MALTPQELEHLHYLIDNINLALMLEANPEMPEAFSIVLTATNAPEDQERTIELYPDDGVLGDEMQFVVIDLQNKAPQTTMELPYLE